MYEVEIKYKVENNIQNIEKKLIDSKCRQIYVVEEIDIYFAHPCRDFAKSDEALRLRIEKSERGTSYILTYKGPRMCSEGKTREEISVEVDNYENCIKILERLGFRKVIEIVKYRRVFQKENLTISLDYVKDLGNFVEIECVVNDRSLIDECIKNIKDFAESIGLKDSDIVHKTYLEMLLEKKRPY